VDVTNKVKAKSNSFLNKTHMHACIKPNSNLRKESKIELELIDYLSNFDFNMVDDEDDEVNMDPLDYFRYFSGKYPRIELLAKHLLCIPATSVPSESYYLVVLVSFLLI